MKQLLLRVPDDVHARLSARAAREGRSVNRMVNEILDAAADADAGDRRARLRERVAVLGLAGSAPQTPPAGAGRRTRVIRSTKGTGPVVDRLLADERSRV